MANAFWPQHDPADYSGGDLPPFLSEEEQRGLVDSDRVVEIVSVRESDLPHGRAHTVTFQLDDGLLRSKSFTQKAEGMAGRDDLLNDVMAHFDGAGDPVPVVFVSWGRGVGLQPPPESEQHLSQGVA